MTIFDAISRVDHEKPNVCDQVVKIRWLSQLDWQIRELMGLFQGEEGAAFSGYGPDTPLSTPLLAPQGNEAMYQRWLEAQIDLANGEYDRYNASILLFQTEFDRFARERFRTGLSRGSGKPFLY